MKKLVRLILALVLLLLLAIAGALFSIDALVRAAIEQGGTHALGVETSLEAADVGLFSGKVQLEGLNVANPEGFEEPSFLGLHSGSLEVDLASLRADTVHVALLALEGIEVSLEKDGSRTNYGTILENLERLSSSDGAPDERDGDGESEGGGDAEPSGGGKQLFVERIVIRDVRAHVDLADVGGELSEVTVHVPEIVLTDVGGADGMDVAELTGKIVQSILEATVAVGGNQIPAELLNDLRSNLASLDEQGRDLKSQIEQVGKDFEDIGKGIQGILGNDRKP